MEPFVAVSECPTHRGDSEAPGHATEERQHRESDERHPDDPRRNRDERADDRRDPAAEDRRVAEALEPPVGAIELRTIEVEPAPAILEQRPSGVGADAPPEQRADGVAD